MFIFTILIQTTDYIIYILKPTLQIKYQLYTIEKFWSKSLHKKYIFTNFTLVQFRIYIKILTIYPYLLKPSVNLNKKREVSEHKVSRRSEITPSEEGEGREIEKPFPKNFSNQFYTPLVHKFILNLNDFSSNETKVYWMN